MAPRARSRYRSRVDFVLGPAVLERLRLLALATVLAAFSSLAAVAQAPEGGGRIALVIGNSAYAHAPALANPKSDAELMSRTLKSAGFEVVTLIDADQPSMKRALLDFGRQIRSRKTEAGLFYYAGHGVQVRGENFLIPVTARIDDEDEVELEGVNVNDFLSVMNASQSAVNIVILDACRNNPFKSASRSASRGLAAVDAPSGTYIAYATSPGQVALDGEGGNSPYTKALAAAMSEPGRTIESVFKTARSNVLAATDRKQIPWETSSITGDFYFRAAGEAPTERQNSAPADPPIEQRAALKEPPSQPSPRILEAPNKANICTRNWRKDPEGRLCVSSVLPSQFGNSYRPENMMDNLALTAWVEGVPGNGVGQVVVLHFSSPQPIGHLSIINGYAKDIDIFQRNGRVRSMKVSASSGEVFEVGLKDERSRQGVKTPFRSPVSWVAIEITDVYPGTKYSDTAISDIDAF